MAAGDFDIRVGGYPLLFARLRALPGDVRDWNKETAERAAKAGGRTMLRLAPEGQPGTGSDFPPGAKVAASSRRKHPKLKQRIRVTLQTGANARYQPGGAGGGGAWRAIAGPAPIGITPVSHDPAFIVTHGSGMRGDGLASSGGTIFARSKSHLMTFMIEGKQVWARSTGGQRGQNAWVIQGRHAASREVRRRLVEFDRTFR